MDHTWAHHFDPETKQQSKQWKHVTSPTPVKFRKIASAGKIMASVFWDSEGVLMIGYLERGKTVTGVYYAELIRKLRSAIKEKRCGKSMCCFIMHLPTPLPWQWLQFENAASNCSVNRRIHQTWLRLTTTCSDLWKICFVDRGLAVMKRSSTR